ncbi:MAG: hypothetical protein K0U21_08710, partial [Proteobacteria bacterium]|nr:hypothetical protein [Pseudomonadota bacterium]
MLALLPELILAYIDKPLRTTWSSGLIHLFIHYLALQQDCLCKYLLTLFVTLCIIKPFLYFHYSGRSSQAKAISRVRQNDCFSRWWYWYWIGRHGQQSAFAFRAYEQVFARCFSIQKWCCI